ncbi:uncharacterized protein RB166_011053 [Leptodactylus fuscus]
MKAAALLLLVLLSSFFVATRGIPINPAGDISPSGADPGPDRTDALSSPVLPETITLELQDVRGLGYYGIKFTQVVVPGGSSGVRDSVSADPNPVLSQGVTTNQKGINIIVEIPVIEHKRRHRIMNIVFMPLRIPPDGRAAVTGALEGPEDGDI